MLEIIFCKLFFIRLHVIKQAELYPDSKVRNGFRAENGYMFNSKPFQKDPVFRVNQRSALYDIRKLYLSREL
jgi:hypothetical protein